MSRFFGGPADGVLLQLGRAPLLLRVVYDPRKDEFDALDHLDDQARFDEGLSAYVRTSAAQVMFIDYADKAGRRRGSRLAAADYRYLPHQPDDPTMRSNPAWQAWCRERYEAGRRLHVEGSEGKEQES